MHGGAEGMLATVRTHEFSRAENYFQPLQTGRVHVGLLTARRVKALARKCGQFMADLLASVVSGW
jgi:hypothetical protein